MPKGRRRARLPRCRPITAPRPDAPSLAARTPCGTGLPVNANMPMCGQQEHRRVEPTHQSATVWAAACLAALQGGQACRTARPSKPEHQNRALTARKQRFLTTVHTNGLKVLPQPPQPPHIQAVRTVHRADPIRPASSARRTTRSLSPTSASMCRRSRALANARSETARRKDSLPHTEAKKPSNMVCWDRLRVLSVSSGVFA